MGLLDIPAPVLSSLDDWLGFVPPLGRLVLWAAAGALLSMELYRMLSPQGRINELKLALDRAQREVADFDGEFAEAMPHLRRMIGLALRRVAVVFPATIVASLPLLVFIVWMDTQYGRAFPPPGQAVDVRAPAEFQGRWIDDGNGSPPRAEIVDARGARVADVAVPKPVPVVHKWRWWNALIGNPAGYLPDETPFDHIDIDLARQEFLRVGPQWLRGWEVTFFAAVFLFAFVYKSARKIA